MKNYVTFGQVHVHSINEETFDKDCVAVYESDTKEEGRAQAFSLFHGVFHNHYFGEENTPDMSYFPRGYIEVDKFKCHPLR